ncbi:MAG: tetratricopeptide repeat protein [Pirellulales bacterium]
MRQQNDDEAFRHLVELGYVDPQDVAARDAAVRSQLESELHEATKLHERGRIDEAVALLESLVIDDPEWIRPHQLLVEIHYRAGRLAEAQTHLDWLTHHGVEHPRLSLIAGGIALARRELCTALDALEYACHVEPDLPNAHMLLGTVLLRLGQFERAERALQQALQKNPADARALDGLAAIGLQRGDYEDAADLALDAIEHDIQLFRAHYHLGVALAHLGRPKEAVAALETAARIAPVSAAPFYWLARIAEKHLGDPSRSAEYRQRVREIIRHRRSRK